MRYLGSTLLLSLAACAGSATYLGTTTDTEPGDQVIPDYDQPIFYADNFYWRNDGGRWYRSSYYDRGLAYANPPQVVARIRHPRAITIARRATRRDGMTMVAAL